MEDANSENVFETLCSRLQCESFPKLAKALGISPQAVYDAKKSGAIPRSWAATIKAKFNLDIADLICLKNKQVWSAEERTRYSLQSSINPQVVSKLLEQLEREREERRELSAENRQLWRENGELKAQVAELKTKLANLSPPIMEQPHESSAKTA